MRKPPDIFTRLARRGVSDEYGTIKQIVSFGLPQMILLYVRQHGHRPISHVLKQIEQWKALLAKDSVVPEPQRSELQRTVLGTEALVWNTLIEANLPEVGPWTIRLALMPTGEREGGGPVYIYPRTRITAVNRKTQEVRETIVPYNDPTSSSTGDAYQKAFEELGVYDLLKKGFPARGVVSARKPEGWPIFTRHVIPKLYELLLPYYQKPGHHSDKRDRAATLDRRAVYPKELLEDMVDILKVEHHYWFADYTVHKLKAVIQRYLAKKASSTKSSPSASTR